MPKLQTNLFAVGFGDSLRQPLFQWGNLVYEKSGHVLTYTKGYYACSLQQKGQCTDKEEKYLKATDFERKFFRHFKLLEISKGKADELKLRMAATLLELQRQQLGEIEIRRNEMDEFIEAIAKDMKAKRPVSVKAIGKLKSVYFDLIRLHYPNFLYLIAANFIEAFSEEMRPHPTVRAYGIMFMIEKMRLADDGKIKNIKLEGIADYAFQLMSHVPGFVDKLDIPIVEKNDFPSLDFSEAVKYFQKNDYKDTFSRAIFRSSYAKKKILDQLFGAVENVAPNEKLRFWRFLKDYLSAIPWNVFLSSDLTYEKLIEEFKKAA
jgi:hypothetical protein